MGSSVSQHMCCVLCEWCRKQEAEEAKEENSETKPILQSLGETPKFMGTQPTSPALKVPRQGSKDVQPLSQPRRAPAPNLEENTETCSAADPMGRDEGWEPAWNPMDFFGAPADEEVEAEVKDLTQADHQQGKVGYPEEKIQPVPCAPEAQPAGDTARGAELVAGEEQPKEQAEPGSDGALCAGITLVQRNILNLIDIGSETGPGCEMEPPADTGEVLVGRDLSLCAGQVAEGADQVEGMDRANLAEINPQSAEAEFTCLVETLPVLSVQNPSEVRTSGVSGLYSTSAVSWVPLCPERGSPEPPNQLLDFLKPESQPSVASAPGMESLHCAEPAGPRELLDQPSHGVLCELQGEGSRGWEAGPVAGEAEPQQTVELPEAPGSCVPVPAKQEAEFPNVPLLLSEVLGSSGEIKGENSEARET
ncbi:hypothetical protein WISP_67365 [Willisornis vidua]|uniref:Uncharacterized protein n=1 Tax=Willisornis vidua TaxID=1566151 RepID=A0ABQ9DEP8_9PASS|nr:hypothetical protein WISP_67365 [Willisornis vidua]